MKVRERITLRNKMYFFGKRKKRKPNFFWGEAGAVEFFSLTDSPTCRLKQKQPTKKFLYPSAPIFFLSVSIFWFCFVRFCCYYFLHSVFYFFVHVFFVFVCLCFCPYLSVSLSLCLTVSLSLFIRTGPTKRSLTNPVEIAKSDE